MNLKKIKSFLKVSFIILMGIVIGYSARSKYTHCLEINASKSPFYGKFATELKKAMQHLGYDTSCACVWPKTVLDFTYTDSKNWQQKTKPKRKQDLKLALVGDCYDGFDIDFLKTYDYLLAVSGNRFGYLAMFNYQAIHFPIKEPENIFSYHCNKNYSDVKVDVEYVAWSLDNIIKRAWHDK